MVIKTFELGETADEKIKYATVMTKYKGEWVFSRQKGRDTFEIPGGHRESGETVLECAKRELYEETGAEEFTIKAAFEYSVTNDGIEDFGTVFYAEVTKFGKIPDFEMEELCFTETLPDNLTYPEIHGAVYERTQVWMNVMSSPEELWDVYDSEREPTGKLHKRGEPLGEGEYHIVVHVFVKRGDGKFLITKRSPNKGYGNMWEITGGSAIAGDDSRAAAIREVWEESGLTLDPTKGKIIRSVREYDWFDDVWLFEHEFDISEVKLLEGETCDCMVATKDEIFRLKDEGKFCAFEFLDEVKDII